MNFTFKELAHLAVFLVAYNNEHTNGEAKFVADWYVEKMFPSQILAEKEIQP